MQTRPRSRARFACAGASPLDPVEKAAMASYHLSAKTISRSHGRSATGAAAYRSGARIADERTGVLHDYRRRRGVEAAFLLLPANAPDWASDRARLWNAAEQAETRKNSTVAREFEIALPAELDAEQRQRLAADFARELVARHGCAADVAIHRPGRAGDSRNHHAHILLTTRRLTAAGFTEKTRELDDLKSGEIGRWRARFAEVQNARLREAGVEARVDHRSLEAQAIDREATIHLGPAATALERRGVPTRLGESNRAVQASHAERQREAEARPEDERRETEPTRPQSRKPPRRRPALRPRRASFRRCARKPPGCIRRRCCLHPWKRRLPSHRRPVVPDRGVSTTPPPETTEAERQRRADEAEPARRQREAERQALLSADIPALERELSEWTRHREWLARHESPPASGWPTHGANWREPSGPRRRRHRRSTPWKRLTPTGARSTSWACCCWPAFPAADAGRFRLGNNGSRRPGPRWSRPKPPSRWLKRRMTHACPPPNAKRGSWPRTGGGSRPRCKGGSRSGPA
jgi:hypothetical protein